MCVCVSVDARVSQKTINEDAKNCSQVFEWLNAKTIFFGIHQHFETIDQVTKEDQ